MMEPAKRGPGRPRNNPIIPASETTMTATQSTETTAQTIEATPVKKRRVRAPVGGFKQRLSAPTRDGYVRRWVNDNGDGRLERMQNEMAYDFVTDKGIRTDGQGSRVSRVVGKSPSGQPLYAYLMETPVEEYAVGVAEKEDRLKPFEDAIRSGRDTTGELKEAETYRPGAGSSLKRS